MITPDNATPEDYMRAHQYLYYVVGATAISDRDYDMFCRDHDLDYKGGSDREEDYSEDDKELARNILSGRTSPLP